MNSILMTPAIMQHHLLQIGLERANLRTVGRQCIVVVHQLALRRIDNAVAQTGPDWDQPSLGVSAEHLSQVGQMAEVPGVGTFAVVGEEWGTELF